MKRIAFTIIALLGLITSRLLSAELSGTVTDQQGRPLEGVSITTDIAGVGTMSDPDGLFRLSSPDNVTRVTFSSVGYQPKQFSINDIPAVVALGTIYYRARDIVVRADRAEAGVTPVTFSNLSSDEIARDYTVGEFPLLLESTASSVRRNSASYWAFFAGLSRHTRAAGWGWKGRSYSARRSCFRLACACGRRTKDCGRIPEAFNPVASVESRPCACRLSSSFLTVAL